MFGIHLMLIEWALMNDVYSAPVRCSMKKYYCFEKVQNSNAIFFQMAISCARVDSILWTIRADADLYKRIGTRVSLPPLAVAQRMEVAVGKGRGGVTLTLTLILKDASYH